MALTRANFETILIARVGKLMTAVDLDGTTVDGTNTDLNDPIGYAIRQTGGSVANVVLVDDSDLTSFSDDDYDQLFDIGELRTLQSVEGNFDEIDTEIGPRSEDWSTLGETINKLLARKEKRVDKQYSLALPTLETGLIDLNFQTHGDDEQVSS